MKGLLDIEGKYESNNSFILFYLKIYTQCVLKFKFIVFKHFNTNVITFKLLI